MIGTYQEVERLISNKQFSRAEEKLSSITTRDDRWHYLYSLILIEKSWFDSAKQHLHHALSINPDHPIYRKKLAMLMGRGHYYSSSYYHRPRYRRRSGCCCACCDCCDCDISCCDLICADQCCECMGGDLIECI